MRAAWLALDVRPVQVGQPCGRRPSPACARLEVPPRAGLAAEEGAAGGRPGRARGASGGARGARRARRGRARGALRPRAALLQVQALLGDARRAAQPPHRVVDAERLARRPRAGCFQGRTARNDDDRPQRAGRGRKPKRCNSSGPKARQSQALGRVSIARATAVRVARVLAQRIKTEVWPGKPACPEAAAGRTWRDATAAADSDSAKRVRRSSPTNWLSCECVRLQKMTWRRGSACSGASPAASSPSLPLLLPLLPLAAGVALDALTASRVGIDRWTGRTQPLSMQCAEHMLRRSSSREPADGGVHACVAC